MAREETRTPPNSGFMALGMSFSAMAFVSAPPVAIWLVSGLMLGVAQRKRATKLEKART